MDSETILKNITTKGLSGLSNMGNTCYMNSAIQALSNTDTFLAYMLHDQSTIRHDLKNRTLDKMIEDEEKKNNKSIEEIEVDMNKVEIESRHTVTQELRMLLKYMWAENCEVRPARFKQQVGQHMTYFKGFQQHDSQEFVTALLDRIHEDTRGKGKIVFDLLELDSEFNEFYQKISNLKDLQKNMTKEESKVIVSELALLNNLNNDLFLRAEALRAWKENIERSYSIINDIFSSLMVTTIKCNECNQVSYSFERSDITTLSFPHEYKEDQITIEQLLKHSVEPEILNGSNQYFCSYCEQKRDVSKHSNIYYFPDKLVILIKKYQTIGRTAIKNNTKVIYPHELDMSPFIHHTNLQFDKRKPIYELYATIRHSGGYGGGHYYAFAKNCINHKWFCYDDDDVYGMEDSEVLDSNSYVLFYQLK